MSDRLDGVVDAAAPLLRRAGEVLTATGAPAEHDVWPALRRVRLLPWEAVNAVAALRPGDLTDAAPELRAHAETCAAAAESTPPPEGWSGTAADAYDRARHHAATHLSGEGDSVEARLTATARLAEDLVTWMSEARANLAATLAEILTSAEALALSPQATPERIDLASETEAEAAADVAARVLHSVAATYAAATDMMSASEHLTEVRWS